MTAGTAECPFCRSEIDEHIAVYGGTCPQCFGEVPGEDAPTDPGAAVRARLEAEDAKTVRRSRVPVLTVLLLLVSIVSGAAWVATRPAPEVPVLDFDQIEFAEIEIVAAPEDVPEPVTPNPTSHRASPHVAPARSGVERLLSRDDVDLSGTNTEGAVDVGPGGTRNIAGTDQDVSADHMRISGPSFGTTTDESAMMSVQRRHIRGQTLTDDSAIIEMVRSVMESQIPRLQSCYQRRLKVRTDLRGAWILEFVLSEAGSATEVTVTGSDMADEALERCVAEKVSEWFFQPIKADLPVRKTLRFRAR